MGEAAFLTVATIRFRNASTVVARWGTNNHHMAKEHRLGECNE